MAFNIEDYILPEADPFVVATDWVEATADHQPGGGDTMTLQDAEAVIVVEVVPTKIRSMIRKVLGFAYADDVLPTPRLHRENPLQHPSYPWMRATSISFSQFPPKPLPLPVNPFNPFAPPAFTLKTKSVFLPAGGIPFLMTYQRAYATVRFKSQRWLFYEDWQIATNQQEIFRNCYWEPGGEVSMISAEGPLGQCIWREGGGAAAGEPTSTPVLPGPVALNSEIKQPFGTLVSKGVFALVWKHVPHEFISSTTYPLPLFKNILSIVGRVNSADFGPFAPGTLLADPPKYSPFQWQISTATGLNGFYGWDVTIPFKQFNPDKTIAFAAGLTPKRGWRTMPWPFSGKWFWATRRSGDPFLPEADFNNIFNKAI